MSAGRAAEWTGRRVCVAGLGLSGAAAAAALAGLGAEVTAVDAAQGEAQQRSAESLRAAGALVRLGPAEIERLPAGAELVITSPGWRPDAPLLTAAADAGVPVWGEVELAWRLRPPHAAPWLALTGTNGKTTTVRMLAAMLQAAGHQAVAAGNVGVPLVTAVLADPPYEVLAVELSSFQLHWTRSIRPAAAAILNVAEDHLDWHGSFAAYAGDKARIWAGPARDPQGCPAPDGWPVRDGGGPPARTVPVAIGNADDEVVAALLRTAAADRTVSFTLGAPGPGQLGVRDGLLLDRAFGTTPSGAPLAAAEQVRPPGRHNVANALAAAALARAYGVPAAAVADGLRRFAPDGHRNATVAEVRGVRYVDDSKATNPHAAAASLAGYGSVVWIAGGLLKGVDVTPLVRSVAPRLRAAVLLGADRAEIRRALARHAPQVPVVEVAVTETGAVSASVAPPGPAAAAGRAAPAAAAAGAGPAGGSPAGAGSVMAAAVRAAAGLAEPGDTVLLAPAAASMDQFRDYADRGNAFAAAVASLAAEQS